MKKIDINKIRLKDTHLGKLVYKDQNEFTSYLGLKVRRKTNVFILNQLEKLIEGNLIKHGYPKLKEDEPYIFISTHSFNQDIISALSIIDRPVFTLIGTLDQINHNPKMYLVWLLGLVGLDRNNKENRNMAYEKMKKLLTEKFSVLLFPEGGFNNSENALVQSFFPGFLRLSIETGAKIVPITSFNVHNNPDIHIEALEPIGVDEIYTTEELNFYKEYLHNAKSGKLNITDELNYKVKEIEDKGIQVFRSLMGLKVYEFITNYSSSISRKDITDDAREKYLQERVDVYMKEVWSDLSEINKEVTEYVDKYRPNEKNVARTFENIDITVHNYQAISEWAKKSKESHIYDLSEYDIEKYTSDKKK